MSLGSLAKAMPNLPIDVGSSWSVHRAAILFCSTTENIQFGTQGKIIYECGLSDLWSLWSHVKVSLTSFCSAFQSERVPSKRIHQEQRREKDLPGKGLFAHRNAHTHVHVCVCVCALEAVDVDCSLFPTEVTLSSLVLCTGSSVVVARTRFSFISLFSSCSWEG